MSIWYKTRAKLRKIFLVLLRAMMAVNNFNDNIYKMHRSSKVKPKKKIDISDHVNLMNNANA